VALQDEAGVSAVRTGGSPRFPQVRESCRYVLIDDRLGRDQERVVEQLRHLLLVALSEAADGADARIVARRDEAHRLSPEEDR